MASLEERVRELRKGASVLSLTDDRTRRKALESMAEALLAARDEIEAANREDIARAEKDGISPSLMQRLKFTDDKIASAVKGLRELAALPDPVGRVRERAPAVVRSTGLSQMRILCASIAWSPSPPQR